MPSDQANATARAVDLELVADRDGRNGEWLFSRRKIYNEQVPEWVAGPENPVVQPGPGPKFRQPQRQ